MFKLYFPLLNPNTGTCLTQYIVGGGGGGKARLVGCNSQVWGCGEGEGLLA